MAQEDLKYKENLGVQTTTLGFEKGLRGRGGFYEGAPFLVVDVSKYTKVVLECQLSLPL